jgi:hypothetical protein
MTPEGVQFTVHGVHISWHITPRTTVNHVNMRPTNKVDKIRAWWGGGCSVCPCSVFHHFGYNWWNTKHALYIKLGFRTCHIPTEQAGKAIHVCYWPLWSKLLCKRVIKHQMSKRALLCGFSFTYITDQGFNGGDYEEFRLLWCYTVRLL